MKLVIQRVQSASVMHEEKSIAKIEKGLLIYIGISKETTEKDVTFWAEKICNLRIYDDDEGRFNYSLYDVKGSILVVSEFTLLCDLSRGRRPNFAESADPLKARVLYEKFITELSRHDLKVETGKFGEHMTVHSINDGPVTILI